MGAARTVTGSRHLLHVNGKNILLDCGMFQDKVSIKADRNLHFGFDPHKIDYVILSHAHIDHSGCLPRLVKDGFRGKIFSSPATLDLCVIMLADSAHIQESDAKWKNKKRIADGQKLVEPLYEQKDVDQTMKLFVSVPYNEIFEIEPGIRFQYTDVGHIIGSAAIHLELTENKRTVHLTFSGDIGRYHDLILKEPQTFPQSDYIICESTYGDRLHDTTEDAAMKLLEAVRHTCLEKKGKLLIPAFSLGRTQEIVYTLDRMRTNHLLPKIPVYVDSPLSTNATDIMRHHPENFNPDILQYMKIDSDPFGFAELTFIRDVEKSKALNNLHEPCIIISASGMLEAGRIKHHVKNNIGDERNTILMVGYCAAHTLGRALMNGDKKVRIFGNYYEVKADVISLHSYSAHADYKEMLRFLDCQDKKKVKNVFLVHGELPVQEHWKKTLLQSGFSTVSIPDYGEKIEI
jgi:metallo-beta-lactamase family protein